MSSKYSYILIGDDQGKNFTNTDTHNNNLLLAGLYLWSTVFNKYGNSGSIEPYWRNEELEKYDIIHINYTPSNIQLPSVIRNEIGTSSSQKIVVNIDVDAKQWSPNFAYYLHILKKDLNSADVLFHVEPHGADILSHIVDHNVHICPHPVDVSNLYNHIRNEREPIIGVQYHRYTAETLMPYLATKNIPLRRILYGYSPVGKQPVVANAGMYDQIMMQQQYTKHIDELSKCAIGIDMYSGFSFGRAPIEMAALGIPTVVSSTIGSAERLFPYTTSDPFDINCATEKLKKLITDLDFTDKVIKHAHENCTYYSLKNSYNRFMEILDENSNCL